MPKYHMREKLRRMSVIVYCLQVRPYKLTRLHDKVCHITGYPYSQSIIEKDMAMLKEEFDCPIIRTVNGLYIEEQYDFMAKIKEWIDLYVE